MGVAFPRSALLVFLIWTEQHDQSTHRHEQREHHEAAAERRKRQTRNAAPMEKHRNAHQRERHRQQHRQDDLRAALAASVRGIRVLLRFHQRLVGGGGSGKVLLRQVDAMLLLRLVFGKGIDFVAQRTLGRSCYFHQRRIV